MEILIAVVVVMWTGSAVIVVALSNAAARGDRALMSRHRQLER